MSDIKLLSLQSWFAVMIRQRTFFVPCKSRRKGMVIIMFKPSDFGMPPYEFFLSAFEGFMGSFSVTTTAEEDREYILHTFNDIEEIFNLMNDEAKKIIDDPKSANIVRKTYKRKDFKACVKAAESCGVKLTIPDFVS